ncbi:ATP-binding protein [Yersinia enterocolitica]|uniref:ATP-binding protein n=2 Tax=Yersinia enterocolitica TaxID=630 RepID=UPI002A525659|nr:ATP-binding protein [Yersinia enterocolitica]HDL6766499.1 ATP-binding protein [Yersinia enterocolitica]HDL7426067.1 ATP-binding protein [Yersinia enterocolitica]HDL7430966.1 ATP-binding protein [Yersinia enterocolitica]HDL7473411.1 ATP-binding protein [Yersinia enterocolitica]
MNKIGNVISSSPELIRIQMEGKDTLEKHKTQLQVGSFLKIEDGNHNYAVATIKNLTGQYNEKEDGPNWIFIIEASPIGVLTNENDLLIFSRGTQVLPVPTELVYTFEDNDLKSIFSEGGGDFNFRIGSLSNNQKIPFYIDGDKFFSKHIGVVGSTGSGKSCAVASLIQNIVGISESKNIFKGSIKNSHVLIFDIHSEYSSAFTMEREEEFSLNVLTVDNLCLPYWLMNSEEIESLFIESNEQNSHNQVSQLKRAVILNKEKFNPKVENITYDSPVYFSINEVYNYICNKNDLTVYEKDSKLYLATFDFDEEYKEDLLFSKINFEKATGNAKHKIFDEKVSKYGGFTGDFERFISRFETKLHDRRLKFLLSPELPPLKEIRSKDFETILKQFLGYNNKANISIVDLSGIPFEVLSLTVSLISRLMFDFAFHYSKMMHSKNKTNDIPFLIVCEEAHNYIPKDNAFEFKASRKSIERIAKEGRKYGLSLMVVSQRPSEVSDTIFSQCNNFLSLRLTNKNDQGYIKALLPDGANGLVDLLPSLGQGEAFIVGDAILMPSLVKLPRPSPEPSSASIKVYKEWNSVWKEAEFNKLVERWGKNSDN